MINITLGNIAIAKMSHSSGMFIGEKNTLSKFQYKTDVNDLVGVISGDENKLTENRWVKNKVHAEDE
ncbi:hypothetical protein ABES02_22855 [Neobacillus pocheonensis]|uniref:hypothetical protein n=1 Tax=Neobacillus pocheonensis TaxID=363869 RepID=UPI003D29965F